MQSASVIRIEKNVDRIASALFALACGYATKLWFAGELQKPVLGAATLAAAAFAYLLSARALGAVRPQLPRLAVPIFDVREVEPMDTGELQPANEAELVDPPELLLTDRADQDRTAGEEPLLLDDILADLGSNSRVVRLFDPAAMPTAPQLGSRFDRNFEAQASAAQTHDAAQALHEALAELRRSLR
jgi:hypothetical protein